MRRARAAERLQDGIIIAMVIAAVGMAATASQADENGGRGEVRVVQAPPSACANAEPSHRDACLGVAAAVLVRR